MLNSARYHFFPRIDCRLRVDAPSGQGHPPPPPVIHMYMAPSLLDHQPCHVIDHSQKCFIINYLSVNIHTNDNRDNLGMNHFNGMGEFSRGCAFCGMTISFLYEKFSRRWQFFKKINFFQGGEICQWVNLELRLNCMNNFRGRDFGDGWEFRNRFWGEWFISEQDEQGWLNEKCLNVQFVKFEGVINYAEGAQFRMGWRFSLCMWYFCGWHILDVDVSFGGS